jgi:hypothetical protein
MKLRLAVTALIALSCATVLASGDTYRMTYQAKSTSSPATVNLLSFAMARKVQSSSGGGSRQGAAPHQGSDSAPVSGQVTMKLEKNSTAQTDTFKKGAQFEKITIAMFGTTPSGTSVKTRHWVLSQVTIDSIAVIVLRTGPEATVSFHWNSITSSTP